MSLLHRLSQGSLFSDESLLQAREGYMAIPHASPAEAAFDQWTQRMTTQHELGIAREMAGLPEETLAALAAVFARTPRRVRTDRLRSAIPIGGACLALGIAGLWLASGLSPSTAEVVLRTLAMAGVAGGGVLFCIGVLKAFSAMPLEVAHGRLGVLTGLLDEQHPWLYKASFAMRDRAADAYRRRILSERGPLRGVDFLMMSEIARAQDAIETTRLARSVAEQLSHVDAAPADAQVKERRLVSVPSATAGSASNERRRPG